MDQTPDNNKKNIVKLAHLYFQGGQWDKALAEYRKILVADPDDMNTHNTLGDIYLKKNSFQVAYESYNKAANGFLSRGQADKAIQIYRKMVKIDTFKLTDEARAKVNFANNYIRLDDTLKMEKVEEAIEILGGLKKLRADDPIIAPKLVELDCIIAELPTSVLQFQKIGDAFLKHNFFEKAQEMFKKITQINPNDISVRTNLAQVYLKQGSESDAKKEYLSIAEEALEKGNLDQAYDFAQKAIALKSVEAHYVSGLIHFKLKKWNEAKNDFEQLLRIKVSHLEALLHLGLTLDVLNQPDKAEEVFHKALKVDKDDQALQEAWIAFCIKHKDKETTIPYLTVLLDKAFSENNLTRAVKLAKTMLQLDPKLIFAHEKLIQILQAQGDMRGAANACCALALVYEKQRKFLEAAECVEKALLFGPSNAEVLEKVLADLRYKASPPPVAPVLTLVEEPPQVPVVIEKPAPAEVSQLQKVEPREFFNQSNPLPKPEKTPRETFEAQMATANQCVRQGLLKAAIEIYQNLLNPNSGIVEVKRSAGEANDSFRKKSV